MKVWVVTGAEYEDWWIFKVCATEEIANRIAQEQETAQKKRRYKFANYDWEVHEHEVLE